jgi:hypothetical protein
MSRRIVVWRARRAVHAVFIFVFITRVRGEQVVERTTYICVSS